MSDLYAGHLLINYAFNKKLGGQRLNPQTVLLGCMVFYSFVA
jgi:hypothetical protein